MRPSLSAAASVLEPGRVGMANVCSIRVPSRNAMETLCLSPSYCTLLSDFSTASQLSPAPSLGSKFRRREVPRALAPTGVWEHGSSLARAPERELRVDLSPNFFVDDAFVFAGVDSSLVGDGASIKDIRQQQPKRHPAERSGKVKLPRPAAPGFSLT